MKLKLKLKRWLGCSRGHAANACTCVVNCGNCFNDTGAEVPMIILADLFLFCWECGRRHQRTK